MAVSFFTPSGNAGDLITYIGDVISDDRAQPDDSSSFLKPSSVEYIRDALIQQGQLHHEESQGVYAPEQGDLAYLLRGLDDVATFSALYMCWGIGGEQRRSFDKLKEEIVSDGRFSAHHVSHLQVILPERAPQPLPVSPLEGGFNFSELSPGQALADRARFTFMKQKNLNAFSVLALPIEKGLSEDRIEGAYETALVSRPGEKRDITLARDVLVNSEAYALHYSDAIAKLAQFFFLANGVNVATYMGLPLMATLTPFQIDLAYDTMLQSYPEKGQALGLARDVLMDDGARAFHIEDAGAATPDFQADEPPLTLGNNDPWAFIPPDGDRPFTMGRDDEPAEESTRVKRPLPIALLVSVGVLVAAVTGAWFFFSGNKNEAKSDAAPAMDKLPLAERNDKIEDRVETAVAEAIQNDASVITLSTPQRGFGQSGRMVLDNGKGKEKTTVTFINAATPKMVNGEYCYRVGWTNTARWQQGTAGVMKLEKNTGGITVKTMCFKEAVVKAPEPPAPPAPPVETEDSLDFDATQKRIDERAVLESHCYPEPDAQCPASMRPKAP